MIKGIIAMIFACIFVIVTVTYIMPPDYYYNTNYYNSFPEAIGHIIDYNLTYHSTFCNIVKIVAIGLGIGLFISFGESLWCLRDKNMES